MYKGIFRPDEVLDSTADALEVATQGYGVANHYMSIGMEKEGVELLSRVADGPYWPSFGACAAEADLARVLGYK